MGFSCPGSLVAVQARLVVWAGPSLERGLSNRMSVRSVLL